MAPRAVQEVETRIPTKADEDHKVATLALRAVRAAEDAHKAAASDPKASKSLQELTARAVEESRSVMRAAHAETPTTPSRMRRQTFVEFTTLLGEEVKEAAQEAVTEGVRYAERNLRQAKSLIEDHFHIDEAFRMLGPMRQDPNLARDAHDWFNLVSLIPVIVVNLLNWSWPEQVHSLTDFWHGEAFLLFWWTTFAYFVLDCLWMVLLPHCVRSPKVIIQHHLLTLGYICVPKMHPKYGWLMGACMIVEVNTWFLIARRSFNKRGEKPFTPGLALRTSLRLVLVSSCFYISWFVIRLGFYPYLLIVIFEEWWKESQRVGTPFNIIAVTPVMQCVFIFLNIKWTIDLIRSKLKGRGPGKGL